MPDDQRLGDPDPFTANPYAPTSETLGQSPPFDDAEAYRRAHLKHEASCQSIGTLFLLSSIIVLIVAIVYFFDLIRIRQNGIAGQTTMPSFLLNLITILLSLAQATVGFGLRRLRAWSYTGGIVLSVVGLLAFPVGTLFCGYFLYLLLSEKGRIVFSSSYQNVIAQTPHIRYRTPPIVWVLLLAIVLLIIFSVTLLG